MPDQKIRIKSAAGSLAWRVVAVSLCLLVLPLLVHSLYLYRADDQHNREDIFAVLRSNAMGQKILLEERFQMQWALLNALSFAPEEVWECFNVQKISVLPEINECFAYASRELQALFVGQKIDEASALVIETPFDRLSEMLNSFDQTPFSMSSTLIDCEGALLAGADPNIPLFIEVPIDGSNFSLYLSTPIQVLEQLDQTDYIHHFLTLLFLIALIGGIIVWLLTRRIAKPFTVLCKTMERVADGAVHVRYTPDRMGFEINSLGEQFNNTLDRLLEQQTQIQEEKIARERLAEELKIGREIQRNLLPRHLPDLKGVDIAQGFIPAKEVGGDFYDLFPIGDGKFLIAIADTAGKGISACLYSLGLRSMLRTLGKEGNDLSSIIIRANELFWHDAHPSGMFVTLWAGIYDAHKRSLEYCSQGHPAALLMHKGKIEELKTEGIAIGAQIYDAVVTKHVVLPKNSLLFLYTDGVIEAHNPQNHVFGLERLKDFLYQSADLSSSQIADRLLEEVSSFSEKAAQHDDITLVAMRVLN